MRLSSSWPRWVNPNSSKGIMGRPSNRISEYRISPAACEVIEMRTKNRIRRDEAMKGKCRLGFSKSDLSLFPLVGTVFCLRETHHLLKV